MRGIRVFGRFLTFGAGIDLQLKKAVTQVDFKIRIDGPAGGRFKTERSSLHVIAEYDRNKQMGRVNAVVDRKKGQESRCLKLIVIIVKSGKVGREFRCNLLAV